eukprot:scaffold74218_cov75-Phaeocystis_antarctica.AAC.1
MVVDLARCASALARRTGAPRADTCKTPLPPSFTLYIHKRYSVKTANGEGDALPTYSKNCSRDPRCPKPGGHTGHCKLKGEGDAPPTWSKNCSRAQLHVELHEGALGGALL